MICDNCAENKLESKQKHIVYILDKLIDQFFKQKMQKNVNIDFAQVFNKKLRIWHSSTS